MESKLHQTSGDDDPSMLPYQLIRNITNNFDEDRKLGTGGFGTVYKGIYDSGEEIAVKVIRNMSGVDGEQFQKEFQNLRMLKHQNLVQFVGFCRESEYVVAHHNGKQVIAEQMHTVLCSEYVPKGSLTKHISDAHSGLDWHTRYKIIKGTCEGLKYLRESTESPIWHLDLKTDNILLDENIFTPIKEAVRVDGPSASSRRRWE